MQGMKCGAAAAGGGGESPVVLLFSQTLTADAGSVNIDLSGVDMSQFAELRLALSPALLSADDMVMVQFNGDSGDGNYWNPASSSTTQCLVLNASGTRRICGCLTLWDCGDGVASFENYIGSSTYGTKSGSTYRGFWMGGGWSELKKIKIFANSYKFASGTRTLLYGYRM